MTYRDLLVAVLSLVATTVASAESPDRVFARAGGSVGVVLTFGYDGKLIASGSAVVVDSRLMATNRHVIGSKVTRIMAFINSRRYEVNPYPSRCDQEQDLCLIEVYNLDVPPVEFGDVRELKVGETVFAIGGPNEVGNALAVSQVTKQQYISPPQVTLSQGMVTALRPLATGMLIQTSAPISRGSSGGGLFDGKGRLVGITTFGMREGQNVNFALPVDWVRNLGVSGRASSVETEPTLPAATMAPSAQVRLPSPTQESFERPPQAPRQEVLPTVRVVEQALPAPPSKPRENDGVAGTNPWWLALGAALLGLGAGRWIVARRESPQEVAAARPVSEAPDPDTARLEAMIADELARGDIDPALWQAILPYAAGDAEKARSLYARRRLPILREQEKERRWREAVARSRTTQ